MILVLIRVRDFPFFRRTKQSLELARSPSYWLREQITPGVKRPWREADLWLPWSIQVKNELECNTTYTYVFGRAQGQLCFHVDRSLNTSWYVGQCRIFSWLFLVVKCSLYENSMLYSAQLVYAISVRYLCTLSLYAISVRYLCTLSLYAISYSRRL